MGSQGWGGAQVGLACVGGSVSWAGRQPRRLSHTHTSSRGGETKVGVLGRLGAGSVGFRGKRMVARWEGVVLKTVHRARDVTMAGSESQDEIARGYSRGGADLAGWGVERGRCWKISDNLFRRRSSGGVWGYPDDLDGSQDEVGRQQWLWKGVAGFSRCCEVLCDCWIPTYVTVGEQGAAQLGGQGAGVWGLRAGEEHRLGLLVWVGVFPGLEGSQEG